jgi:hypothetical protein
MFLRSLIQYPLYDVDDNIEPITDDVVDDDNEEVKEEDLEEDDDPDDTTGDDDEEKDEEGKEKEDEVNEDEIVRLNWPKLKEKYPELAKDPEFKQLKNTVYREQEFTKLFPNPKDAEEALTAQGNYEDLRSLVLSGNTEELIKSIGDVSEKSLDSFASSFLPSLRKTNSKLYAKVTTPLLRRVLSEVARHGKQHDDTKTGTNIQNAARVVNKIIFDDDELGKVEDDAVKDTGDKELDEDRKKYFGQKQQDLLDDLVESTDKEMDDLIGELDPGKVLEKRPKLKAKMLAEIKDEIRKTLANDRAHNTRLNTLWQREQRNGFSGALKDSIKTTFMSRAKVLIPEIRKRVRADYLGATKDSDKNIADKIKNRDRNIEPGRNVTSSGKKVPTAAEAKKKGMTAKDILDID